MKIFIQILCFSAVNGFFLFSHNASAYPVQKCGEIKWREIGDIFEMADDMRYVYDIRGDLISVCKAMESLAQWEGKTFTSGNIPDLYEERRDALAENIINNMNALESPLKSLEIWRDVDPHNNKVKEAYRVSGLHESKENIHQILDYLDENKDEIDDLQKENWE